MSSVKTVFNDDVRRCMLPTPTFEELGNALTTAYSFDPALFKVKWLDEENDLVTISSDVELLEALQSAAVENKILKLFVTTNITASPSARDHVEHQGEDLSENYEVLSVEEAKEDVKFDQRGLQSEPQNESEMQNVVQETVGQPEPLQQEQVEVKPDEQEEEPTEDEGVQAAALAEEEDDEEDEEREGQEEDAGNEEDQGELTDQSLAERASSVVQRVQNLAASRVQNLAASPRVVTCSNPNCRIILEVPMPVEDWQCEQISCAFAQVKNGPQSTHCHVCRQSRKRKVPVAVRCALCSVVTPVPATNAARHLVTAKENLQVNVKNITQATLNIKQATVRNYQKTFELPPTEVHCPHCELVVQVPRPADAVSSSYCVQPPLSSPEHKYGEAHEEESKEEQGQEAATPEAKADVEGEAKVGAEGSIPPAMLVPVNANKLQCPRCERHFSVPGSVAAAYSQYWTRRLRLLMEVVFNYSKRQYNQLKEVPASFNCQRCLENLTHTAPQGVRAEVLCHKCDYTNVVPATNLHNMARTSAIRADRSVSRAIYKLVKQSHIVCDRCGANNKVRGESPPTSISCHSCAKQFQLAPQPAQSSSSYLPPSSSSSEKLTEEAKTPVVDDMVVEEEDVEFQAKLTALREMGFSDHPINRRLLREKDGSLERVVNFLLM